MDGDLVAVVVLVDYLDVPGYGAYLRGDVATFEKPVAEALIQRRGARRFQEVPSTTPAPSANTAPEQASKLLVAQPATLAPLPKPVPAVERALFEPRGGHHRHGLGSRRGVPRSSSPRLAQAVKFLREVLGRTPKPATEVKALAGQRGISQATLRRAKRALGVKVQKRGMRAGWVWVIREGTLWG